MPPLPGQRWAPFDSLGASAGISKATVGKLAKAGRFRSIRLPGIKNVRIGDVEDFNRLLDDIAAQGPDFEEAPEVKPGSKRRGRPKKPVETASES
jgi:hypothetical protein